MARKKTPKTRVNIKASLSRRLREIRQELFGEHGGPELARRLGLPARTWYNYETGVTVPAEVLLGFIEQTGANPMWLLAAEGPRYQRSSSILEDLTPVELIRRGLEQLETRPASVALVAPSELPVDQNSEYTAIKVVPLKSLGKQSPAPRHGDGYIMAFREWIPNSASTVAVQLTDDAMAPVLPAGSFVAIDRSVIEPQSLHGRIVAACPEGKAMIRWLDLSGRHLILRPNLADRDHPLIPVDLSTPDGDVILGQVVWSWSRFG